MKKVIVAASALVALIAGCNRQDDHAVAKVNRAVITQTETALELRDLLWRNGETWNALEPAEQKTRRVAALNKLLNQRLIADFAQKQPDSPASTRR
ncbi:MAG: SurA N-terminal domain-containing protein, partial [Verrucomicrobia bacterium]|nr:SurA N-terminal domain-containing protein [Verrucomicrobiota bacterium]